MSDTAVVLAADVLPVGGPEAGEGAVDRAEAAAVQHWSAVENESGERSGVHEAVASGDDDVPLYDAAGAEVDEALAGVDSASSDGDGAGAANEGASAARDEGEFGATDGIAPAEPGAAAGGEDSGGAAAASGALEWEPVYHCLVAIDKLLRAPALRAVQLPPHVVAVVSELLLYPHTWVRLAASRALARVLAVSPAADAGHERRIVGGMGAWLSNARTQFATVFRRSGGARACAACTDSGCGRGAQVRRLCAALVCPTLGTDVAELTANNLVLGARG